MANAPFAVTVDARAGQAASARLVGLGLRAPMLASLLAFDKGQGETAPGLPRGRCAAGSPDRRRNLWAPGLPSADAGRLCRSALSSS